MRLIDADKVKSKLQQHRDLFVDAWGGFRGMSLTDKSRVDEIDNCIAEIVNEPTIEATPVVHGRWIERARVKGQVYCSECGTIEKETNSNYKSRFCPNCGSDMRGEKHGEK